MFVKARGFRSRYGIITYYRKPKSDRKSESLSKEFPLGRIVSAR